MDRSRKLTGVSRLVAEGIRAHRKLVQSGGLDWYLKNQRQILEQFEHARRSLGVDPFVLFGAEQERFEASQEYSAVDPEQRHLQIVAEGEAAICARLHGKPRDCALSAFRNLVNLKKDWISRQEAEGNGLLKGVVHKRFPKGTGSVRSDGRRFLYKRQDLIRFVVDEYQPRPGKRS